MRRIMNLFYISTCFFLLGCSSPPEPPDNQHNICAIFKQYPDWYKAAHRMQKEWKTPIPLAMAIIKQESAFIHDAAPKKYFLGFIPTGNASSAIGYSQAIDATWERFEKEVGDSFDREEFAHAIEFIGWYTNASHHRLGISFSDAENHYKAYHLGHGGFSAKAKSRKERKTKKSALQIASKVSIQTKKYKAQLKSCLPELEKKRRGWFSFWS